jgi:hypothetical protein
MFRTTVRVVAALLTSVWLVGASFADDSKLKVKVGDAFPDFKLPITKAFGLDKEPEPVSLASLKGKNVVIAFYPKANTGG